MLTSQGSWVCFVAKYSFLRRIGIGARFLGGSNSRRSARHWSWARRSVYTTGYFYATADFDPGVGVYALTSAGSKDIFVSKLNTSGNFVWAEHLGGANAEQILASAVGPDGSVYTTGYFEGSADFDPGSLKRELTSVGSYDVFVSKLDPSGRYVRAAGWAVRPLISPAASAWGRRQRLHDRRLLWHSRLRSRAKHVPADEGGRCRRFRHQAGHFRRSRVAALHGRHVGGLGPWHRVGA